VADVSILHDALVIELTVPERVLSLHAGTITIPLRQITKAVAVPDVMAHIRGMRMPGAAMPGRLAVGTWRGDQAGRSFHDFVLVHRAGPGLVLTLNGNHYDRIVLETARAQQLIAELEQ
jgi:hypothetical protein